MLEIPFSAGELLLAALWLLQRLWVLRRQKRIDWRREAVLLLMLANLAVILRLAFFPVDRVDGRVRPLLFDAAAMFPPRLNLVPLVHLLRFSTRRDMVLNLAGNACLLLPSGILLPALYRNKESFGKTLGTGLLMSLGIELLQLPFSTRATDVDDLILNALGCAVGYGIWTTARRLGKKRRSRTS